jgi:hypothetical protein
MSLFMDVHTIDGGVGAEDVAAAHRADLATQGDFGVNYLRYWVDTTAGKIFCLVDAPDADAATWCTARPTVSLPTRSTPSASTPEEAMDTIKGLHATP